MNSHSLARNHTTRYSRLTLLGLSLLAALVAPLSGQTTTQTVNAGSPVTFSVSADGNPSPTFQWRKNGTPVAGATTNTFTLSAATLADAGTYSAVATNSLGSAVSNDAVLIVNNTPSSAPVFTSQPTGVNATANTSVTFTAAASGVPSPTYQWFRNGTAVAGATGTSLTLPSVTTNDSGTYTVVATNLAGSVTSNGALLSVTSGGSSSSNGPVFTQQPADAVAAPLSTVTFTVAASGSPAPTVQWYRNGQTWPTWNQPTLTLSYVSANDAGTYYAIATNSAGTATSNSATLTVGSGSGSSNSAPAITAQPVSQSAMSGGTVSFTVAASGTPTPTYQWLKDGAPISGATSSTLTLSNVSTSSAGSYSAVASNSAGSVASSTATLTVSPLTSGSTPPAFTLSPQSQTVKKGATVTFTVAAAGTPAPTIQWRKDGVAIPGATGATLTLNSANKGNAGNYSAVATNVVGSATSSSATLTVLVGK